MKNSYEPPKKDDGLPHKPEIEITLKKTDNTAHQYLKSLLNPNSYTHGPVRAGKKFVYDSFKGKPVYNNDGREVGKLLDLNTPGKNPYSAEFWDYARKTTMSQKELAELEKVENHIAELALSMSLNIDKS